MIRVNAVSTRERLLVCMVLSAFILMVCCTTPKTMTGAKDTQETKTPAKSRRASLQRTLTLEALQNAEYRSQYFKEGRVKLSDGKYKNADSGIVISLSEQMGFGDVTGDGIEDAVVILKTETGGSAVFYDIAVVVDENGIPTNVASAFLGDSLQIESIYLQPKSVVVNALMYDEDDEECCPTIRVTKTYQLERDSLVELGES